MKLPIKPGSAVVFDNLNVNTVFKGNVYTTGLKEGERNEGAVAALIAAGEESIVAAMILAEKAGMPWPKLLQGVIDRINERTMNVKPTIKIEHQMVRNIPLK